MFFDLDILDERGLDVVFAAHKIDSVIHFAALKAVGESVRLPLEYYHNNLGGLLSLLRVMRKHRVHKIVFSSSATVYGTHPPPLSEESPTGNGITNPYGWSKFNGEQILKDMHAANNDPGNIANNAPPMGVVLLRYFNPVGAHASARIGEDPCGVPNNLMPYVQKVATGQLPRLTIFGSDWNTHDGFALRDYVHVVDIAKGHISALRWLNNEVAKQMDVADVEPGSARGEASNGVCEVFNLGTGKPLSVLEVVKAFEKASGVPIPYVVGPRRTGDVEASFADVSKADRVLGWRAQFGINEMCRDTWRWAQAAAAEVAKASTSQ